MSEIEKKYEKENEANKEEPLWKAKLWEIGDYHEPYEEEKKMRLQGAKWKKGTKNCQRIRSNNQKLDGEEEGKEEEGKERRSVSCPDPKSFYDVSFSVFRVTCESRGGAFLASHVPLTSSPTYRRCHYHPHPIITITTITFPHHACPSTSPQSRHYE